MDEVQISTNGVWRLYNHTTPPQQRINFLKVPSNFLKVFILISKGIPAATGEEVLYNSLTPLSLTFSPERKVAISDCCFRQWVGRSVDVAGRISTHFYRQRKAWSSYWYKKSRRRSTVQPSVSLPATDTLVHALASVTWFAPAFRVCPRD